MIRNFGFRNENIFSDLSTPLLLLKNAREADTFIRAAVNPYENNLCEKD